MIIGLGELEELLYSLNADSGWEIPSSTDVRECRDYARNLDDGSRNFVVEVAAMFFAMSDKDRFGNAFAPIPPMFVYYMTEGSAYDLSREDIWRMLDLQDRIGSGLASWDECRDWFELHLVRR